jgi:homoserine O-acetyltransferase
MLKKLTIPEYRTESGFRFRNLPLSYQTFGKELGTAPIVLVMHALTGNSSVAGKSGWWTALVEYGSCIDLNKYTVISFDIPGNGYNGFLISEYEEISVLDVANWFLEGLRQLQINSVYVGIGGSLGGCILWQMAVIKPDLFENLIPIATNWKATDWVLAQCRVQKQILKNSQRPVHDARVHAMTFYRTPASFKKKFNRSKNSSKDLFNVESWLLHHGERLEERFHLQSYKLMNHLLMTANIETYEMDFLALASNVKGNIYLIGINSDGLYLNEEIKDTYSKLKSKKDNVHFAEINSIHGHDAFLIEYEQLAQILDPIFNSGLTLKKIKYEYSTIG